MIDADTPVELVLDAHAVIGESPTFVREEGALYWIDVRAPALHRLRLATGETRHWEMTSDIGAFALAPNNTAVVALRSGIHRLDLATGKLELLAPSPFDTELFRFNEGKCDPNGRFWVGVMFDPLTGSPPVRPDALHSFTVEGGLREEPDASELHNGMAWNVDASQFFLSHTKSRKIHVFEFDKERSRLRTRRLFAEVDEVDGLPDGAAMDTDGFYWCALHGGGRLRRYAPDGSLDAEVPLPVSQPTMCAFGGDNLDTLFVTSAAENLSNEQKQAEPHAGGIFRLKPGVTGVPRRAFLT